MYILHQESNLYWVHTHTVLLGFSPVYNLHWWSQHCWLSCLMLLPTCLELYLLRQNFLGLPLQAINIFQDNLAFIARTRVSVCSSVHPLKETSQERKAKLLQGYHTSGVREPLCYICPLFWGNTCSLRGGEEVLQFTVLPLWWAEGTYLGNTRNERNRVGIGPGLVSSFSPLPHWLMHETRAGIPSAGDGKQP